MLLSPSTTDALRRSVHETAKMLARRSFVKTSPARISADDYVDARWPEFVSKAVDFLAMQAALEESAASK